MNNYPCKKCEDRHYICWENCERYQAIKNIKKTVTDEAELYLKSKGTYYKTKYGWKR